MNYSVEASNRKIALFRELREFYEDQMAKLKREQAMIESLLIEWECEAVESEEGEIIPHADYTH